MKTRILLFTLILFGSQATGWGQTITADGVSKSIAELSPGSISTAKIIKAEGNWTNELTGTLKKAFKPQYGSSALVEFDMGTATFANEEITEMKEFFNNCTALVTVTFPTVQSNNKFSLEMTFNNCTSLTKINNLDKLGTITNFRNAFYSARILESVTLPALINDNENVSFSNTFYYCYKLQSIKNLDKVSKVNSFNHAFNYCQVLNSLKLPAGNGDISVDFNGAFANCQLLASIENLDKFTKATDFQSAFQNCSELTSITLPENGGSSSFQNTFNGCGKLSVIENLDKWNITSILGTFKGCNKLVTLELSPSINSASFDLTNTFEDCINLVSITNLDKLTNFTNLSYAFSNCEKLTYIAFNDDAKANYAKGVQAKGAFSNCKELVQIKNLGKIALAVGGINNMFKSCKKLTSVELVCGETYGLGFNKTFEDCNPNCLIYLGDNTNTSGIPTKNVIKGGIAITDIILTDEMTVKEGEENITTKCPFYCPKDFSLGDKKITYTRTFDYANKKSGWNTLCLPFDAKLTTATETLPYFSSTSSQGRYWAETYTNSPSVGKVNFDYVSEADNNIIPANTPCIIGLPGEEFGAFSIQNETLSFTATGITISATPKVIERNEGNYTFKGNYDVIENQSMYLLKHGTGLNNDSFALENEGDLTPFRAYFIANNTPAQVSALGIDGKGTSDLTLTQAVHTKIVTGGKGYIEITSSKAEKINITAIDGRIIDAVNVSDGMTRINVAPGIYITDGEKVVVR